MDTLALSYNQLPHHLRPLFLCLGVFPEDYEIPVSKLIWLWIAEGYIEQVGRESLEVTARDYLLDLLKRSLVVIAKTGSDGGIKSCRIHDLLRDLCLTKAEEEKYSPGIYRFGQVYPFATSFFSSSASIPSTNGQQQPSLYDAPSRPPPQPIQPMPSYPSEISMVFQKEGLRPWQTFKLLRALDMESIFALLFPWEAVELIQLRYLAILAKDGSPPASVSNLLNLQTLIISSKRNITVPKSMWKLLNLRHLHIRTGRKFC